MEDKLEDLIRYGQYVILEKKDYKKIHLMSEKNEFIFVGKNKVELGGTIGKQLGSTFKLIPKLGSNRHFTLQLCSISEMYTSREMFKDVDSGADNRSICDDGSSQVLTADSIEELRSSGAAPQSIMEQIVENSKTFKIKTEYSQEKYINKKEKKYFEFVCIKRPTLRMLAEILYDKDISSKSIGIRIDTLSQFTAALNLQPDGKYLLVESGYKGIVAATILNLLSEDGKLVLITPGNQCQKQAVLAMNFSSSQISNMMTLRFKTVLEIMNLSSKDPSKSDPKEDSTLNGHEMVLPTCQAGDMTNRTNERTPSMSVEELKSNECADRKRKWNETDCSMQEVSGKKPRWAIEAEQAQDILLQKVDGLAMACKEFSIEMLDKLLDLLKPSRPLVIYSQYVEPLVTLYLHLKPRHDILFLKITETWLRPYQILQDRSHPSVTVSSSSGFLLCGIKVI